MKRFFLSAAVFLVSSIALAMPKVGDEAVFNVTSTTNGVTTPFTIEMQLTAFNASTNQYTRKSSIIYNGQVQSKDSVVDAQNLISDASVAMILANCPAAGGALQNVSVPAGTFDTCALPLSGNGQTGTIWIGTVTFGIVKQDSTSSTGTHTTVELVSHKPGQ